MPRVDTKKKNAAGKPYACCQCPEKIKPGESYYQWSFRFGGTYRQHVSHGHPKPSQLTQSKMSGAYAAIESAEASIAGADNVEDMKSALEECAGEIDSVADEYQDSFDSIPENLQQGGPAQEMQEKIEALQSFSSELQDAAGNLEEFDEEEPLEFVETEDGPTEEESPEHEEWQTRHDEHLEEQRSSAEEALGNLSI